MRRAWHTDITAHKQAYLSLELLLQLVVETPLLSNQIMYVQIYRLLEIDRLATLLLLDELVTK